jgi:hypothetical protein
MNLNKSGAQELENKLIEKGYTKYIQHYKNEDYMYWKSFDRIYTDDGEKYGGYSVGYSFYDWSKYPQFTEPETCSIGKEFMLGTDIGFDRLDISITDRDMTIEEFEEFCANFYEFFINSKFRKDAWREPRGERKD